MRATLEKNGKNVAKEDPFLFGLTRLLLLEANVSVF